MREALGSIPSVSNFISISTTHTLTHTQARMKPDHVKQHGPKLVGTNPGAVALDLCSTTSRILISESEYSEHSGHPGPRDSEYSEYSGHPGPRDSGHAGPRDSGYSVYSGCRDSGYPRHSGPSVLMVFESSGLKDSKYFQRLGIRDSRYLGHSGLRDSE